MGFLGGGGGGRPDEAALAVKDTTGKKNWKDLAGFFLWKADIHRQKFMLVTTPKNSKAREVVLDTVFELLISVPGKSLWQSRSDLEHKD